MRVALDSGYVTAPPPPPPPPPPHKVQAGETVQSVAKVYHVTPQAVAHTNHITVDATLHAGQVLQLPANAFVTDVPAPDGGSATQTPQQKTDAAAKAYQQAVKDRDQAMADAPRSMGMRSGIYKAETAKVDKARAAFDSAVQVEINGKVADANQGVPGEFRTSTDQLVKTYGDQVVARYAGDPGLKAEAQTAVHDTQVKARAGSLIPGFAGSWTATEKLQQIDLKGQPQEVVDAVLADPRVQQWVKQAAADVGKPLDGVGKDDLSTAVQSAGDASTRLADATTGMAPALAAALVEKSMPTITKMGQLDHRYAGMTFENLSRAVDAMHGAPDAAQATTDVAAAIKPGFGDGFGFTGPGANGAIARTIGDGNGATLAIEMARQLKADGNQNADAIIGSLVHGAEQLQSRAGDDLKDYAGQTEELSWLIKNEGGVMTAAQLKQAIAKYKADKIQQDPNWEKNIQQAQDKVVADGKTLAATIAALQNLPPDLRNDNTARAVNDLRDHVGGSETTQDVLSFAIDQDPTLMQGEQGKAVVDFYSGMKLAGKGRTFFGKLVNNYVAQTLLPRVQDVDPNHPETIASAKEALAELKAEWKQGHWSRALGLHGVDIDTVIKNVEASLPHEGDTVSSVSHRLETLDKQLEAAKGLGRNTAAGSIFRAFGFATNAAWFAGSVSSSGKPVEAAIGGLAAAVGMSQSVADFGASINLLDADGSLANWGAGTSAAGKLASKFVAWAAVGLSADAAVRSFASGDVPAGILNTTAAGGGAIAILFADTAWGGPVGIAIGAASVVGLGIYGHVKEANKHENARTVQFLKDAGFSPDAAKALSDQSGNGYSPVPLLVQYAKDKGYNMSDPAQRQTVVDWVNGMSSTERSAVRDWMHHTLDDFHGDASKLGTDTAPVWPMTTIITGAGVAQVYETPHSVGALDGMMKNYGVTPLPVG